MKHLWEVDHDYYCNESNYFSNDCHSSHATWRDFEQSVADEDFDMNLIFRWDWSAPRKDDEPDGEPDWQGDENYRDSTLKLFYMGQRKGLFRCVEVSVCRADEPRIVAFLKPRYDHMMKLWLPFAGE